MGGMIVSAINKEQIWDFLKEIPDPEVPAINIVELGVVRDVLMEDDKIQITITPTYSGCPAMKVMEEDILSTLKEKGFQNITIKTVFSPAWTCLLYTSPSPRD